MKLLSQCTLWIGLLAVAPAFADPTDADQSTQAADQIRKDVNTQAAIIEAVDKMKAQDEAQAAAQKHYKETVDAAEAEHEIAIAKCEALTGEVKAACKDGADGAFKLAKSEAEKALEAHTSAQP